MKGKETVAGNSSSSRNQKSRSTGPVDRRAQHAQSSGRSTDRSTGELCLQEPNSRVFWVDRWVDRKRRRGCRSTGPVDRQSGLGGKLLLRRFGYLRLFWFLGFVSNHKGCGKRKAASLLHSKRLLASCNPP